MLSVVTVPWMIVAVKGVLMRCYDIRTFFTKTPHITNTSNISWPAAVQASGQLTH